MAPFGTAPKISVRMMLVPVLRNFVAPADPDVVVGQDVVEFRCRT